MNKNILITIKKELRSIFRDKKTILTMLLFPLIIPCMIFLYGYLYDNIENEESEYKVLVNFELTDEITSLMESINIKPEFGNTEEEIEGRYKDGGYNGYVFYTVEDNTYTIYADLSSTDGLTFEALMRKYFEIYNDYLTKNYLIERDINIEEAYTHFNVDSKELSNNNYMLTIVINVCITYIIMSICMATSNMAISTTAQEKENGTLETILTFPIKKKELIIGKYLASVCVGFLTAFISLILTLAGILVAKESFEYFKNFQFTVNTVSIIGAVLVIFFASLFIAGCALALTSKSKSFKEAQSQVGLLNMVAVIPLFVSLASVKISSVFYLIPICNFEQLLMDLFSGSMIMSNVILAGASTILLIMLVVSFIIKAYNSEDILFKD